VTFLVQLSSSGGSVPQGTVSCFDNLIRFVSSIDVHNGAASCSITFQSVGVHEITAVFKTDDVNKWASSAANVLTVTVTKGASTISLNSSQTPAPFGAGVAFTAGVTGGASGFHVTDGTVQFFDGGTLLGTAGLDASGTAAYTTSALAAGHHTIRGVYSGDATYDGNGKSISQEITAPPEPQSEPQALTQAPPASTETHPDPQPQSQTAPSSMTATTQPSAAGTVAVAPTGGGNAATTVDWSAATFGTAAAHVSATVAAPLKTTGVQFAAGSSVIQIDAVTDSGQPITALSDVLDIAIPHVGSDVVPMYQRGDNPWVVIPRLGGTTLPAGQPDGWYRDGSTLHILTRHLTRFGLAAALDVKWGTRRRVHLRWARRVVVFGAPSVDATATYTLRKGSKVFGTWKRTLPAGKGAPANLWLAGKNVGPGHYKLTIVVQAGPQRWTQVVAIRYLR
jgi:hypothetical protein